MAQHSSYAESKDGMVMWAMIVLVILSIVGALALQKLAHKPCRTTDYVYCGDGAAEHHAQAGGGEHASPEAAGSVEH